MNISETQTNVFPKGEKASPDYFTGEVWVKTLVPADDTFNTSIGNVEFKQGARNNFDLSLNNRRLKPAVIKRYSFYIISG